jgi:hypothetical protein
MTLLNMSRLTAPNLQELHDKVVKKAAETIFRKNKVVINLTENKVASVGDIYPDLVVYEVLSTRPFIASDKPSIIGQVEVGDYITEEMLAKWEKMANLDIDKLILIIPEKVKNDAMAKIKDIDKIEIRTYNEKLYIR